MTVGVYGLVAAIVSSTTRACISAAVPVACRARLGAGILRAAPWLMKFLSFAGTAAMFLVGGGILVHGVPALHHAVVAIAERADGFEEIATFAVNLVVGVIAGGLLVGAGRGIARAWQRVRRHA
jgi:predicted DNA repair protein MutK